MGVSCLVITANNSTVILWLCPRPPPFLRAPLEPVYFACVCWSRSRPGVFLFVFCVWWQTHFTCRHRRSAHSFPLPVLWPKLQCHKKGLSIRGALPALPPPSIPISGPVFSTIFICTPRPRKSCADMASKIVAAVHNKKIRKGKKKQREILRHWNLSWKISFALSGSPRILVLLVK